MTAPQRVQSAPGCPCAGRWIESWFTHALWRLGIGAWIIIGAVSAGIIGGWLGGLCAFSSVACAYGCGYADAWLDSCGRTIERTEAGHG